MIGLVEGGQAGSADQRPGGNRHGEPSFRRAATRRRCVAGGRLLRMAGLYGMWRDPDKGTDDPTQWLWTCTLQITTAQDAAGQIHDRSPLVLPDDLLADWLDPKADRP